MQVRFYHLTTMPVYRALPQILEKILQKEMRSYLFHPKEEVLKTLSRNIWHYKPESFITHGLEFESFADQQPILLGTTQPEAKSKNKAETFITISAEALTEPYDYSFAHWMHFFDGSKDEEVSKARGIWKVLKAQDSHKLSYFQQTDKGWETQQS